jgi:hypothetical protein
MNHRLIVPLIASLCAAVAVTTACTGRDAGVPPALAGQRLANLASGEPAAREIARLHGRQIGALEHVVASYGDPSIITLYLSRYPTEDDARSDLLAMSTAMADGAGPFEPIVFDDSAGGVRFRTRGLGLDHLFYRAGRAVVWLQAPPDSFEPAVEDLDRFDRSLLSGD